MGDYIKEKYGDEVYTIGFIAHEGSYGFNKTISIESPSVNSLEYLIGQSPGDNYFLPLKNISFEGYLSRPLGHQNMTNDIAQVMDGVIFNRYMRKSRIDWELLLHIVPENRMWKSKKERFIREYKMDKETRENNKLKEAQKKEKGRA